MQSEKCGKNHVGFCGRKIRLLIVHINVMFRLFFLRRPLSRPYPVLAFFPVLSFIIAKMLTIHYKTFTLIFTMKGVSQREHFNFWPQRQR
ncbi:MAG TPA: hypothetical protein PLV15_00325, partial [Smithella sp.]|nr:hypothetical protein [Smithella sp.]